MAGTSPPIFYQHSMFYPQPGDIILRGAPDVYPDGTVGPLVKLYRDPYYFTAEESYRKAIPQVHKFTQGEKILRLFKLRRDWAFFNVDTHMIYLYYPRVANLRPWFLVNITDSGIHLDTNPPLTNFTHLPPSTRTFAMLKDFAPGLGDIIIRTIPDSDPKTPMLQMCKNCLKLAKKGLKYELPGLPFSLDSGNHYPMPYVLEYEWSKGCEVCQLPSLNLEEIEATELPWQERWEIQYWSEDYHPEEGDIVVRYQIDMNYTPDTFNNTHLQVELFKLFLEEGKYVWRYLGMDVEDFGPDVAEESVIERPLPGDITISRHKEWFIEWDPYRKTGGYVVLHKDPQFFKDIDPGDDLYSRFTSMRKEAKLKEVPADSWLVRVGKFDEYWDFHLENRARVFVMHQNKLTMGCHSIVEYPHMAQLPNYEFDKNKYPPEIMSPVEITPNQWDLIIRQTPKLAAAIDPDDWRQNEHHWMRDPMLWGKDHVSIPFDEEVEILLYEPDFKFEDDDLLLRAGFDFNHVHPEAGPPMHPSSGPSTKSTGKPDMNPPNYTKEKLETPYGSRNPRAPPLHTGATVELYHVEVGTEEDAPIVFRFMGRDKFIYPDEPYYKEPFFTRDASEEEEVSSSKQEGEYSNTNTKGQKIVEDGKGPNNIDGKDSKKDDKTSESKKRHNELQDKFAILDMAEPSKKRRWGDKLVLTTSEEAIYDGTGTESKSRPIKDLQDVNNLLGIMAESSKNRPWDDNELVLTASEDSLYK